MILYQYRGGEGLPSVSPPCLKVWLALRRIGVEHEVKNWPPQKVREISRTGRLPVLELDDGTRIHESVSILDALEERFPDADLFRPEPVARVRDRLWDHYGTDVMYWFGFHLRWIHPEVAPRTFHAFFGQRSPLMRLMIRLTFARRARLRGTLHGIGGLGSDQIERGIVKAFQTIDTGLQGGPFLDACPTPGRGDLACVALAAQVGFRQTMPEIEAHLRRFPALPPYIIAVFEACSADPPDWLRPA